MRGFGAPVTMLRLLALTVAIAQPGQAQTFTVLHNFTGQTDGAGPFAGLTMDAAGSLYGTTWGGALGYGTVFKLASKNSGWIFAPLYSFTGGSDGAQPQARVILGHDGALYGTASSGGAGMGCNGDGCGVVFKLQPPATACKIALCPWTENVLYSFTGGSDGGDPYSEVIFDQAGNLYGTTVLGGPDCYFRGCGVVYELTRSDGGGWTEGVLYSFSLGNDGAYPVASVVFDNAGNLYGTTSGDMNGIYAPYGTVYELMPSGMAWAEKTIYTFQGANDGGIPLAGLIVDQLGNLYGATSSYGENGGGTVFTLTPSGGIWTFESVYGLEGGGNGGPARSLTMDAAGNLYGTAHFDGAYGYGSVFKFTKSGNSWAYTSLHDFTGGSDGGVPVSSVVLDKKGNIYGTTFGGGANGAGVVFEIAP